MRKKIILVNILFALILFETIFPVVVKKYNFMTLSRYGVIEQEDYRKKSANTTFKFTDEYNDEFINLIKDKLVLKIYSEKTIDNAIKIREQLLNLSRRSDSTNLVSRYPDKLFKHMISNKSLLCGELARL